MGIITLHTCKNWYVWQCSLEHGNSLSECANATALSVPWFHRWCNASVFGVFLPLCVGACSLENGNLLSECVNAPDLAWIHLAVWFHCGMHLLPSWWSILFLLSYHCY